ncbi:MAG: FHA domain-containing protein, partial [Gemmatimonas sp.]
MLQSVAGDRRFSLAGRQALVVGRDPVSDLPILDPAVSRRHAELRVDAREPLVHVTDFGSRNGTWINNARITRGVLRPGDRIAFGTVAFTLEEGAPTPVRATPAVSSSDPGTTLLRERVVPSRDQALADVARDTEGTERATQRLTQLVRIAQRLGAFGDLDGLLEAIASELFDTFDADRVAILLSASDGLLETRVSRDRRGAIPRPVPRAIAHGVAERQVALLTNDASSDARTAGESVLQQSVKSAMAAPLLGEHRAPLGVLSGDHRRDRAVFEDDDRALLGAFAASAAAAVEREPAAEQLSRAARVRENFERYFTPQIAERIAAKTHQVEPGGTRLPFVVMFTDIRGFTAIAESLPPM